VIVHYPLRMRLVPRFSLRFALLALTIFLIVFGVGVKYWREKQEHERLATWIQSTGGDVEEESNTLFGMEVGKRVMGIGLMTPRDSLAYVELLEQFPQPNQVQRLWATRPYPRVDLEAVIDRILQALPRFPELQELHLHEVTMTPARLQMLSRLPKLRTLDLSQCEFPPGTLKGFEQCANLEVLVLDRTNCELVEVQQLNLPRLKIFKMSESKFHNELPCLLQLTLEGWGRFPQLEALILRDSGFLNISVEANALPRLKFLDLGDTGMELHSEPDWPGFVQAMPKLEMLALPMIWLQPDMVPELAKFKFLKEFYSDDDPPDFNGFMPGSDRDFFDEDKVTGFGPVLEADVDKFAPPRLIPAFRNLIKLRPDLLFSNDYNTVRMKGDRKASLPPGWRERPPWNGASN
jgi:hypothetical protein